MDLHGVEKPASSPQLRGPILEEDNGADGAGISRSGVGFASCR